MRTLSPRPTLPESTTKRLQKETDAILASSDQKQEAERRHNNDEYGNLTPKWRTDLNSLDPRAKSTVENLALDRDALQQTRQQRIQDLKVRIEDSLSRHRAGELSQAQLEGRCREWRKQPFQPDVADYFLAGPGKDKNPFREFLVTAGV